VERPCLSPGRVHCVFDCFVVFLLRADHQQIRRHPEERPRDVAAAPSRGHFSDPKHTCFRSRFRKRSPGLRFWIVTVVVTFQPKAHFPLLSPSLSVIRCVLLSHTFRLCCVSRHVLDAPCLCSVFFESRLPPTLCFVVKFRLFLFAAIGKNCFCAYQQWVASSSCW
jgi:hypothetical protein